MNILTVGGFRAQKIHERARRQLSDWRCLPLKLGDLSSIPDTHRVESKNQLYEVDLWLLHTCWYMHAHTHTHAQNIFPKNKRRHIEKTKTGLTRHFPEGHLVQNGYHQISSTPFLPHKPTQNNRKNKVQKLQMNEVTNYLYKQTIT